MQLWQCMHVGVWMGGRVLVHVFVLLMLCMFVCMCRTAWVCVYMEYGCMLACGHATPHMIPQGVKQSFQAVCQSVRSVVIWSACSRSKAVHDSTPDRITAN